MMEYANIPLARPRNIRLLSYDGLHSDGNTLKFSLKSIAHEIETIVPRDSTLAKIQGQDVQRPRFHALSYTWGDSKEMESIYCNDTCVQITRNLHDALVQISTQFPDQLFWVDALCINQNDLAEKAMQVAMMGDIFYAAEHVVIWLGRADGLSSSIAFQSTIDNFIQIRSKSPLKEKYPACQKCKWTLFEQRSPCGDERHRETAQKCPGLRELTRKMGESKWFSRMWTFQELKLASSAAVYLGPFSMPWEFFVPAFDEFNRSHGCVRVPVSGIAQLNKNIEAPLGTERFAALLSATRHRQATLIHDRIFAVMGIPTRVHFPLKVDYSMPLDQLYTAVTRFCVHEDNNPGVLSSDSEWDKNSRMSNLPSWVVDFSADFIKSGHTNVEFGQLPSLPSSELSLNMYCFVLGFYVPGDERFSGFHNSRAPDFRPLPHCVFSQISSKTGQDPPKITVSQPQWISNRIGNVDNVAKLYDHYTSSSNLLSYLENHIRAECSCRTQTDTFCQRLLSPRKEEEIMPKPGQDEISELACILVNQNGHAPSQCMAVQPAAAQKFKLAGSVNWPVSWPHGYYWIPEWKQRLRGKTLYKYSMAFTSIELY